jgi:hypothetical protein
MTAARTGISIRRLSAAALAAAAVAEFAVAGFAARTVSAAEPPAPVEIKLKPYLELGERAKFTRIWLIDFHFDAVRGAGTVNGGAGAKVWGKREANGFGQIFTEDALLPPAEGKERPAKVRRQYDKAFRYESVSEGLTGGNPEKPLTEKPMAYAGKTLIATLEGKDYKFTDPAERALTGLGMNELEKEFNNVGGPGEFDGMRHILSLMLPKKPITTGSTWDVDVKGVAQVFQAFGFEPDYDRSQGEGKCVKVYEKAGRRWALMNTTVRIGIKKVNGMAADQKSSIDLTSKMDLCIDGKIPAGESELNGKIAGTCALNEPLGVSVALDGKITGKQIVAMLPPVSLKK